MATALRAKSQGWWLGGQAATQAEKHLPLQGVDMTAHTIRRTHREQAMRDLRALSRCVLQGSYRKSVPVGEVPLEVWRLLLLPHAVRVLPGFGVGHSRLFPIAQTGQSWLFHLLACMRFQLSAGNRVHKACKPHVSDEGLCSDVRIVHAFGKVILPLALETVSPSLLGKASCICVWGDYWQKA